jgi:glycosyltransferase involved in cell wall biosynthesis
VRFCTVANPATLPFARVLARGLAQHHPDDALHVLLAAPAEFSPGAQPFEIIGLEQLAAPGSGSLLADRRWGDLTELLKPQLLRHLIAREQGPVVFLGVGVDVHARLAPVESALERHAVVVARRSSSGLPADGLRPGPAELQAAGRLGASLVGAMPSAGALQVLDWWAGRVHDAAMVPPEHGADRRYAGKRLNRWIDIAPPRFPHVAVLDDAGSAVSHWNLHERVLELHGNEFTVDGRALRFAHFEGFDPARPFLPSIDADRVRTSEHAALAALCEWYASRLEAEGWRDLRRRADVGRRLPGGIMFDDTMSHLLADAAAAGAEPADLFSEQGAREFLDWLRGPAPYGASSGVNRFLYELYCRREDLQDVYPNLDGPDGRGFAGWAWVFGRPEMGIPEELLPSAPAGIDTRPASASAGPGLTLPRGPKPEVSLNVTGLFTGTLGLGEAARGYVRAAQAADIPVSTTTVDVRQFVTVDAHPDDGYGRVDYTDLVEAEPAGFNLICINADELPAFAEFAGGRFFERPAIGVWGWETDHVPERWRDSFGLLDEIWVYSDYVAQNLARVAPIPVRRIPPPVSPPDPGDTTLDLDIPEGFRFLFMFDFFSTIQRKNAVGLVDAFRSAFSPGEGPQLVVKTINGVHRPHALEEVLWAARGRPDVHVVDRSLSARERDALLTGCDCYVSLHRSEGFGLTLAECMALGKPVIGTAFSGTTDFMTEHNSYPVEFRLTRVGADCEIYPAEGTWADPDLRHAAQLMRIVVERPDEASAKGEVARSDIERLYAPAAVGQLIRTRLEEIAGLWADQRRRARKPMR